MEIRQPIYGISEAARELSLSTEWLREGEKRGALPVPARLAALRFALDCYAKKEAAAKSRPDDAEGSKNDRTATEIIPKPS